MIEYNKTLLKTEPFKHQADDTVLLLKNRSFALFSEMGSGKSKIVVDAACCLHAAGEISLVLVVAPAGVRRVWLDKDLGQIRRHAWRSSIVYEFHRKVKKIWDLELKSHPLNWVVTNYEYVRPTKEDNARLQRLVKALQKFRNRFLLVLDESSAVKDQRSGQHEACKELRKLTNRCIILNGTPGDPLDVYNQFDIMDPRIMARKYANFFHFKFHHCDMVTKRGNGRSYQKIVGWKDMEQFHAITKPYVVRHLKRDCLDLPEKIGGIEGEPVIREVALKEHTWEVYKTMRQEAILALPDEDIVPEPNAMVRILRLAQITSGHVTTPATLDADEAQEILFAKEPETRDISKEKLDWAVNHLIEWSTAEATVVWCRWRRERERLAAMLRAGGVKTYEIYGNQKPSERATAEKAFHPETRGAGRRILVAQPHAGGKGLDLAAAEEAIYLSCPPGLEDRKQSEDRLHRATTINRVTYLDVLATGPKGQRTIDHLRFNAMREEQELEDWTCSAWLRALKKEVQEEVEDEF
jgi:SNF2 family DNA or RNA helicase